MSERDDLQPGTLPTEPLTREQRVVLVESLLVTPNALKHLDQQGLLMRERMMERAGCCKPDGGTCCVNARPSVFLSDGADREK